MQPKVSRNQVASGKQSAGLLLYRQTGGGLEVLFGHPGGPFWRNKDLASWSIPKGLIVEGERPLAAAKREFAEETGHKPRGKFLPLGEARQPGGKIVHVWAAEDDWDVSKLRSRCLRWNGRHDQGSLNSFLNSTAPDGLGSAHSKILKGQAVFLRRLLAAISDEPVPGR